MTPKLFMVLGRVQSHATQSLACASSATSSVLKMNHEIERKGEKGQNMQMTREIRRKVGQRGSREVKTQYSGKEGQWNDNGR